MQNIGGCRISEEPVGQLINRDSGSPFTLNDPCVQSGATVGYDARAHTLAIEAVEAVLRAAFRLEPATATAE